MLIMCTYDSLVFIGILLFIYYQFENLERHATISVFSDALLLVGLSASDFWNTILFIKILPRFNASCRLPIKTDQCPGHKGIHHVG